MNPMPFPTIRTPRLRLTVLNLGAVDALIAGDAERLRALTGASFRWPAAPPY
ncbi:MAG: hypothetical protein H0V43_06005, partial [Gemmatimonadales bacterium]|nr:hypothetical protein [Gemmatimonadales bacterium]